MPIYEYNCGDCKKRFSLILRISEIQDHPSCEFCGSSKTNRLVSRFRTIRSEDQILENMSDPSNFSGIDENDPRSVAKWAKKMAKEMGEDMGDEIEQMAEEEFAKGPTPDGMAPTEEDSPGMPPGMPFPE
ncbi:MAG: zinc ribbon domain-containing protein [Candidatus Riflebacteria bacterium]|nr:zinc ribbon domain-containing protein [Candidatus Riflebacteria bacterium]